MSSAVIDGGSSPKLSGLVNIVRLDPPARGKVFQVRPIGMHRPFIVRDAGWTEGERVWAESVGDDVANWSDKSDEHVVAEVSRFKIYKPRQAELLLHRIRAPGDSVYDEKFDDCYQQLPAAVWIGWVVPLDNEPASTLIRRLVCSIDFGLDSARPIPSCSARTGCAPVVCACRCPWRLHRRQWSHRG